MNAEHWARDKSIFSRFEMPDMRTWSRDDIYASSDPFIAINLCLGTQKQTFPLTVLCISSYSELSAQWGNTFIMSRQQKNIIRWDTSTGTTDIYSRTKQHCYYYLVRRACFLRKVEPPTENQPNQLPSSPATWGDSAEDWVWNKSLFCCLKYLRISCLTYCMTQCEMVSHLLPSSVLVFQD